MGTTQSTRQIRSDAALLSLTNRTQAKQLAVVIWELYLGGNNTDYKKFRPFGDVVLDGIDLDMELVPLLNRNVQFVATAQRTNMADWLAWGSFVTALRRVCMIMLHFGSGWASVRWYRNLMNMFSSKSYLITMAPINPIFSSVWQQRQFGTVFQVPAPPTLP